VLYLAAEKLVREGKAFVCDLTAEQVREYRGSLTEPGRESPWRNRTVEENLDLLRRMRAGEFADGSRTLRAKIDMASATSTCATRPCTASSTSSTRTPATRGRSTRCTTSPTR
jgi:glutamyl/glutaminyl-tRNA synthetase